jgi:hypothetical protein
MNTNIRTYTVSLYWIYPFIALMDAANAHAIGSELGEDPKNIRITVEFENADDLLMFELKYGDIYRNE